MRVRIINRRQDAMLRQSSHDNIFSEVSKLAAPRGIPANISPMESAQVLRPEVFKLASKCQVTKTSLDQTRGVGCFEADAEIITQHGCKPFSALGEGDFILTRDNGFQPLLWAGKVSGAKACPMTVEIKPDAVMAGKPDRVLRVSGRQSVLLTCPEIQSQFGSCEVLARAGDLLQLPGFSKVEHTDDKVAVLMPQHEMVNVNGLWMDSLMPDGEALNNVSKEHRNAIKAKLPNLGAWPIDRSYPSARILLRTEFARQFTR